MSDLIPRNLAAKASQAAEQIAVRLADPETLAQAAKQGASSPDYPYSWGGASLYSGHAGNAVLFQYASRILCESADAWRTRARDSLREAARGTRHAPLTVHCVGAGVAGIAYAVTECTSDEPAYAASLNRLNHTLAEHVAQAPRWNRDGGVWPGHYDVVRGASGVLGHLASVSNPDGLVRRACERLVEDLVWLCDGRHWQVPPAYYHQPDELEHSPYGYIDLGMAHGIPGPLAALCVAWRMGYRGAGVRAAIGKTAAYLADIAGADEHGPDWPHSLSLDEAGAAQAQAGRSHGRPTWCYGAPGVCSALLDAADVLHDEALRAMAVKGFDAALGRLEAGKSNVHSPTLCHGFAGALTICRRFAIRAGSARAAQALAGLTERILAHCDPTLPLGVQDIPNPDRANDNPGFLDGAAGVALALWSVSVPVAVRWPRALMVG